MFKNALVRTPSKNFAAGLTSVSLGAPVYEQVIAQHAAYCGALQRCGVSVTVLEADPLHPDSTFVEDAAVLTRSSAILTRPGENSRAGEVETLRQPLARFFKSFEQITPPGTLDGGDICEAGNHFFIGISRRTNQAGALQLESLLSRQGYTSSIVDIRAMATILHLKSGIACVGDNHLVVMEEMAELEQFRGYRLTRVRTEETYAANCLRVNDHVLIPSGFAQLARELQDDGYSLLPLEMSEFQKMDGGLSCLSLRL